MIKISLPDGSVKEYEKGVIAASIVRDIGEGLFKSALAVYVNDNLIGLNEVVNDDCNFRVVTFKDDVGKEIYRHTCSHVLAQAVKSIYPTAKLAIGPAIKSGFYYDIDFKTAIVKEDFPAIEAEMKKIINADFTIEKKIVSKKEAADILGKLDETYKLELLNEIEDNKVTLYFQGNYVDLCRGPHLPSTGKIKAFKLTNLAGAYWKGDEKNKMLTRIYGTAFDKKSDLDEYILKVEEAKKRDHNKLGRELNIFMTDESIGQGLPLLMPKGARIIQLLQRFVEDEEQRRGYKLTKTPLMAKRELYITSGHWDHYRDSMFIMGDVNDPNAEVMALRPMTCPFQFTVYNNGLKSYRDLPLRYNETSTIFRNESSGEMHGLIRVRQFTISEGHLAVRPDQIEAEFKGVVDLIYYFLSCLGMSKDVSFRFSKWDPKNKAKYIDNPKAWEDSEKLMKKILDDLGIVYTEAIGEAAFYGPKLDIQTTNVFGKEDTLITAQIDFELAERFNMSYIDQSGNKATPYVIHRTSIGCYERTLALLIEKYNGALPLWITDIQVKVLNLSEKTEEKAKEFTQYLLNNGIRAEADLRGEKIGYKIREAQLEKVPYMVIIGEKEIENNVVAVRDRKLGDIGVMKAEVFVERVLSEIKSKKCE